MIDITKIHAAFTPATEINDPHNFVGRYSEISKGVSSLSNKGSFIVIHGQRGVGKSSLAGQIAKIAKGDDVIIKRLNLYRMIPNGGFNYIVCYKKIDGFVHDVKDLISRIMYSDDANNSLFSFTKSGDKQLDAIKESIKGGVSAKFLGAGFDAAGNIENTYKSLADTDLVQAFRRLLGTVRKDNSSVSGLLILIDEFDTLKDKTNFASIVKACSDDFVKFCVVGIGLNVSELIKDHGSIGRQTDIIQVGIMPHTDLEAIIRRAEEILKHEITFSQDAVDQIVSQSEGFPYFVHLLGKETLMEAFLSGKTSISKSDVDSLLSKIAQGQLNTVYDDLYQTAVGNSRQRELLLKLFAEEKNEEIFTENIYPTAKELEIENPSQYMKQLTSAEKENYSPVLIKLRDKYYRFSDPVFKVYAKMRTFKYG